jgi:hypothetical protein
MVATKYFKTKDSIVTIGSIEEQSGIVSDIVISGGEKPTNELDAIDGTGYVFVGSAAAVQIQFDFLQGENYNIVEIVYGPETTAGSPVLHSLNWGGAGVEKTITLNNVRSVDDQELNVTLTDVIGISAPITAVKGSAITRTFTGTVSNVNITETVLEEA